MRAEILELEQTARRLEPPRGLLEQWSQSTTAFAVDFIEQLPHIQTYRPDKDLNGNSATPATFEPDGCEHDLADLLQTMRQQVIDRGLNPASGGHLGYIPGGGVYPAALGDYLAAVSNQYAGMFFAGPGAVRMEHDLIRWMCRLVGYPATALGNLSSGGSLVNLIAFVTARDLKQTLERPISQSVIYLTEQVHHCVHKAIRIGGMAGATIRHVPMDDRFRMDVGQLRQFVQDDLAAGLVPFLVVASAGTTDTGAIDPLNEIAEICRRHDIWLHVDAAYGGFFLLVDTPAPGGTTVRDELSGIELSDSVAIDPHKGLFLSYGLGAVLIKDVAALQAAHHYRANYMQDTLSAVEELNPADLSPELTKHFRGLRMWLPLQLFGIEPFKAALKEKILLCRYFYEEVRKLGFEVGPFPQLSVCIFRYRTDQGDCNELNRRIVDYVHRDGRVFVSSTTIEGQYWMRLAVLCFRTHLREIDMLLEILRRALAEIVAEQGHQTPAR